MALSLSDFTKFNNIVVQCHDNPDADALASGYALTTYLKSQGKDVRFVYGGKFPIQKANLLLMTERLEIPAEYVTSIDKPELLITVDCQYKESNVTYFEADNIAVIDHHQVSSELPAMSDVRSAYGSCSTILYELLQKENVDINSDINVSTALYYGLMTDTGGFAEISHPADKDLRDFAKFKIDDILMFKNSNLSREELSIAGDALNGARYDDEYRYGIIEAAPCDPNILGIISDMFLEVSGVDTCLVYSILPFGVKLSVRSCIKEVRAGELASYLAEGMGGGGGHMYKAGGLLKKDLMEKASIPYEKESLDKYIDDRMSQYFKDSEIIYASNHHEDISQMSHYVKNPVSVGYVEASKFAKPGGKITVRTLEGDVDVDVEEDLYIIIGVEGEIYPCTGERFKRSYQKLSDPYVYPGDYPPTVIDMEDGARISLLPFAKSCLSCSSSGVFARELTNRVKVFTAWDEHKYYLGTPGDFLAVRADDTSDVYVINREIFYKTYTPAED
ncbi:nanoRNase/pAp phosphatase, hydrolyzes c-di-AMP and oligoRNAs [Lachnospiraceae bacterium YSD2013]|nr:nanoRNase/pAp phosphatase, hydrolyzes c-di-AMP and oligoRNAs [Lachnospiraceae bacterium YSD2013]